MHKRRRFFFYKARAADWVRRGMRVPFILASVACSLAWADGARCEARCYCFSGERQAVRQQSVQKALQGLLALLAGENLPQG